MHTRRVSVGGDASPFRGEPKPRPRSNGRGGAFESLLRYGALAECSGGVVLDRLEMRAKEGRCIHLARGYGGGAAGRTELRVITPMKPKTAVPDAS